MAALRDNLDASASCTLPEVPLHWRHTQGPDRTITHKYTWGLDLSGLAGQGAAGGAQSRDREGAVPGMGVAPGVSPVSGSSVAPGVSPVSGSSVAPSVSPVSGIHNAGGIGGLLAVEAPQAVGDPLRHWYFYDGNGNVGQLLAFDATGPTVTTTPAAKYEYDPYGQLVNHTDNIANPFRFSTKWFDTTTGPGYWGYRYYSPRLGRWMSRDPIGETGGINLLVLLANEPVNRYDALGLKETSTCTQQETAYCEDYCRRTGSTFKGCVHVWEFVWYPWPGWIDMGWQCICRKICTLQLDSPLATCCKKGGLTLQLHDCEYDCPDGFMETTSCGQCPREYRLPEERFPPS